MLTTQTQKLVILTVLKYSDFFLFRFDWIVHKTCYDRIRAGYVPTIDRIARYVPVC